MARYIRRRMGAADNISAVEELESLGAQYRDARRRPRAARHPTSGFGRSTRSVRASSRDSTTPVQAARPDRPLAPYPSSSASGQPPDPRTIAEGPLQQGLPEPAYTLQLGEPSNWIPEAAVYQDRPSAMIEPLPSEHPLTHNDPHYPFPPGEPGSHPLPTSLTTYVTPAAPSLDNVSVELVRLNFLLGGVIEPIDGVYTTANVKSTISPALARRSRNGIQPLPASKGTGDCACMTVFVSGDETKGQRDSEVHIWARVDYHLEGTEFGFFFAPGAQHKIETACTGLGRSSGVAPYGPPVTTADAALANYVIRGRNINQAQPLGVGGNAGYVSPVSSQLGIDFVDKRDPFDGSATVNPAHTLLNRPAGLDTGLLLRTSGSTRSMQRTSRHAPGHGVLQMGYYDDTTSVIQDNSGPGYAPH